MWFLPAYTLCLNYWPLIPINQLNHIYISGTSMMNSSSTITREYSWSRGKALQIPSITCVTEVGSAVHQAFCGSHQFQLGWVLPWVISHWYGLSTRGCLYPESFVNGVFLGLAYIAKQKSWSRFVCSNCSLALIVNHKIRICSFAFGSIYEPYSI